MSENIKSETISRRKMFSLLGLVATFSVAVPATVLSLSDDAEAQTTTGTRGQQRRAGRTERRQTRRTGRTERRAVRRGVAPAQQ